MLKNFVRSERKTEVSYDLSFDDGYNNGFGFPCDQNGNLSSDINPYAKRNYHWCIVHPEQFRRYNKVTKYIHHYTEPAHGTCICGNEVQLYDQYYGACECEQCGRWYNLFGQELMHPQYWENDPSEEEYY